MMVIGARTRVLIVAAAAAAITLGATPAWADKQADGVASVAEQLHGVLIGDGERVALEPEGGGPPKVLTRGAATKQAVSGPPVNDTRVETTGSFTAPPISAAPDTLVATFHGFGAQGATVTVENGFAHPIIYDAAIVVRRGRDLVVSNTSICPIRARSTGVESWGGLVTGIILSNPREPPGDDMHCSGGSGLVAGGPPAQPNICTGEVKGSPIQVSLYVDPTTGARLGAEATWVMREGREGTPIIMLDYPMQNERVAGRPTGVSVTAMASLDPPTTSKAASIVLLADGVEATRRPWRMYAQRLASPDSKLPSGTSPVAFVGIVPFPLRSQDGSADPQLAALFAAIGDGRVKQLEVRVEGDDGVLISHGVFSISSQDIRNGDLATAALRDAEAKLAAPGHCARPRLRRQDRRWAGLAP